MLIHTADSMAASRVEITCAVRCTMSRSATSSTTIVVMKAIQTHAGVLNSTKSVFSPVSEARVRTEANIIVIVSGLAA